jgi:hypothetical protein
VALLVWEFCFLYCGAEFAAYSEKITIVLAGISTGKKMKLIKCPWCSRVVKVSESGNLGPHVVNNIQCVGVGQPADKVDTLVKTLNTINADKIALAEKFKKRR